MATGRKLELLVAVNENASFDDVSGTERAALAFLFGSELERRAVDLLEIDDVSVLPSIFLFSTDAMRRDIYYEEW